MSAVCKAGSDSGTISFQPLTGGCGTVNRLSFSAVALTHPSRDGTVRGRELNWEPKAQPSLPSSFLRDFSPDWFHLHLALWQGVLERVEAATRAGPCGTCSLCLRCEAQGPEPPAAGESSRLWFCSLVHDVKPHTHKGWGVTSQQAASRPAAASARPSPQLRGLRRRRGQKQHGGLSSSTGRGGC